LISRRLILTAYLILLLGLGAFAGLFFRDAWDEYSSLRSKEEENRRSLMAAEARLTEQETRLQRLRTDPSYVEKVIRQNLRYVKPDEMLFNFEP
jgi:cell division protein DivIC